MIKIKEIAAIVILLPLLFFQLLGERAELLCRLF